MDKKQIPEDWSPDSERFFEDLLRLAGARPEVPPERLARIKATARSEWTAVIRPSPSFGKTLGWSVAAAAAVVVLAVWIGRSGSDRVSEGNRTVGTDAFATVITADRATVAREGDEATTQVAQLGALLSQGQVLRTGARGFAGLRLADQYSIRLDEGTSVRFESSHVLVLSQGALYVDSGGSPNGATPLEIRTPFGTARNQGTQFEVRLQDAGLRVRVREGVVRLDRTGQTHTARAGQQLMTNATGGVDTTAVEIFGADWRWITRVGPPFDLAGKTLGQFLEWVSRETGYRTQFIDPALERSSRGIVLEGSIAGVTPEDALTVVLPTCGLRHRLNDGVVIIERAAEEPR